MRYRVAKWAVAGFLVASGWAVYFFLADKDVPTAPLVSSLLRLSCPVAILGFHHALGIYSVLAANVATYAAVGLVVESLRRQANQ